MDDEDRAPVVIQDVKKSGGQNISGDDMEKKWWEVEDGAQHPGKAFGDGDGEDATLMNNSDGRRMQASVDLQDNNKTEAQFDDVSTLHHLTRHWLPPEERGQKAIAMLGAGDVKSAESAIRCVIFSLLPSLSVSPLFFAAFSFLLSCYCE